MVSAKHAGLKDLIGFAMEVIHEVGRRALDYYGKGHPQIKLHWVRMKSTFVASNYCSEMYFSTIQAQGLGCVSIGNN